jgi:hypothetical protein
MHLMGHADPDNQARIKCELQDEIRSSKAGKLEADLFARLLGVSMAVANEPRSVKRECNFSPSLVLTLSAWLVEVDPQYA